MLFCCPRPRSVRDSEEDAPPMHCPGSDPARRASCQSRARRNVELDYSTCPPGVSQTRACRRRMSDACAGSRRARVTEKGEGRALGESPPLPVSAGRATPRPRVPGLSAPRPPDAMARRPERRADADDRDEDAPRHPHRRRRVHRRQEPGTRGRKRRTATSALGSPEQHPPYIHEQRSCPHNLSPCTHAASARCGGTNPHSSFSRFSAPRRRTDHC